jgi:hypothetical protein
MHLEALETECNWAGRGFERRRERASVKPRGANELAPTGRITRYRLLFKGNISSIAGDGESGDPLTHVAHSNAEKGKSTVTLWERPGRWISFLISKASSRS